MGANPPCKECLVQSMCITNKDNGYNTGILRIRACDRLNDFVENNYWFNMS
jgi:uncharacterized protein (UPF0179 family)